MKNKTFFRSVLCAVKGLCLAIRTEKNFRVYFLHILVTLPVNILLDFSVMEYMVYGICVLGVFSAECLNTAIEHLCDSISKNYDEKIKIIKDIAAGAVCCWGIAFYLAEAIMLGRKFFA